MYVCLCQGITSGQIQQALEQGAASLNDLSETLGVTQQCGQCQESIKQILKEQSQTLQSGTFYRVA